MWVDSHSHLTQLKLTESETLDSVIKRAKNKGVDAFLCIATDIENTRSVQKLCENWPNIWTSAGVHPLNPEPDDSWQKKLKILAQDDHCVAIGETGLDFHYATKNTEQQWQIRAFEYHIELSKQLNKPLIIHTRSAQDATLELLKNSNLPEKPGVIHCFTEDWPLAQKFLDLGFYISFSGIVTFKNAQNIREAMINTPLDRILIETDSPYLAPVPFRGKQNFPEYVVEIGEFIASQRYLDVEQFAQITTQNFCNLFDLSIA